ncbi:hypothetical protein ACRAWD_28275 [Caulobacter segnis]
MTKRSSGSASAIRACSRWPTSCSWPCATTTATTSRCVSACRARVCPTPWPRIEARRPARRPVPGRPLRPGQGAGAVGGLLRGGDRDR